jgi:hypothetical protein
LLLANHDRHQRVVVTSNLLHLSDLQHVADQDDSLAKYDPHELLVLVVFERLMHRAMEPDDEFRPWGRCQSRFDLRAEDARQEEVWWFRNAAGYHQ